MKKLVPILIQAFLTLNIHCTPYFHAQDIYDNYFLSKIIFNPSAVETTVVQLIEETKETIDISLYSFDNIPIKNALVQAYKRNILIRISTDKDSLSKPDWQDLINIGITVIAGNNSGIMHDKYLIFDKERMITGSANLTKSLFTSFNNTVLIYSPSIIKEYLKDFEIQWNHYYGPQKEEGYQTLISKNKALKWSPGEHNVGIFSIFPYFSPYKNIIEKYQTNDMNLKNCNLSCIKTASSSQSTCKDNSCKEEACYDSINPGILFQYFNYDSNRYFCPMYNHAMNPVITELKKAKKSVIILAFSFRDYIIMDTLLKLHRAKVNIKVWIDSEQYNLALKTTAKTYQKLVDTLPIFKVCKRNDGGLLHHKVIIIDNEIIVLGSLNFSSNAVQNNDENYLIIKNALPLSTAFQQEIEMIDSTSYIPSPIEESKLK